MVTTRFVSAARRMCRVWVLAAVVWPAMLQAQPDIDHPGIECIAPGKYAVILSGIDPELEVATAKVYFRSSLYPDFYYVEMTYENGRFQAVLPKPSPETTQIIYYLEAIDNVFNGTRTLEWDPEVEDCDDDPAAAYFTGDEAGIVVGATTGGQAALPPGFSAAGIIGTIASTGIASGLGGGVGAGTAVAIGATVAGAAGAVVVAGSPGEEPTTSVIAAAPSSVATTSAPAPDPAPSSTSTSMPSTTTSAPTTTTTVPGTTTSTTASSSTSSTPVSTTTTTVALPPLNADCFEVRQAGECRVRLDATTCVDQGIDRCDWVLDVEDRWRRVTLSNDCSSVFFQDWEDSCDDDAETIQFRLTVHRGTESHTAIRPIIVAGDDLAAPPGTEGRRGRLETHLAVPPFDGSVRGRIVVNESTTHAVDGTGPAVVWPPVVTGANTVTATLTHGTGLPGHWRFDFQQEPRLEPGSIRVSRGNVLTLGAAAVVFRLRGEPGESVEFSFERRR